MKPRPWMLKLCRRLVSAAATVLPAGHRERWEEEWHAEIEHRWRQLNRWKKSPIRRGLSLLSQSLGTVPDALWVLQQLTIDSSFLLDVRHGLRLLRKNFGFSLTIILTLGLGIGANAAIFSVVNAVLLQPLPYPHPDQLVRIYGTEKGQAGFGNVSPMDFLDWEQRTDSFQALTAFTDVGYTYTGGEHPRSVQGLIATPGFFEVAGIGPWLGRGFRPEEGKPGAERVVVLSHSFWQTVAGADPQIVGKPIHFAEISATVIGVMPPDFQSPRYETALEPKFWTNLRLNPEVHGRGGHWLVAVARLQGGTSQKTAQTEMDTLMTQLEADYPSSNTDRGVKLVPLQESVVAEVKPALLVLQASVGLILLIACANVTGLLLARTSVREKEIAIRAALGAGRVRLTRQLLAESLLLASLGGAAGLALAQAGMRFLLVLAPRGLPHLAGTGLNRTAFFSALLLSGLTGVLVGLVPAVRLTRPELIASLKESGRTFAGSLRQRVRGALVISEISLSLILLVATGLLLKSFWRLLSVDPGFRVENRLTITVDLPGSRYAEPQQVGSLFSRLEGRLRALPGVEAVGGVNRFPLGTSYSCDGFSLGDRPLPPFQERGCVEQRVATPGYFRAMGIKLVRGRLFSESDAADAPPVAVINQGMADQYWPGQDPLGKRFAWGWYEGQEAPWQTIVGVVGNVRHFGLDRAAKPEVYSPQQQASENRHLIYVLHARQPLESLSSAVRRAVEEIDPLLPLDRIEPAEYILSSSLAQRRYTLLLLAGFAGVALLLTTVGVYGLIAYTVARRTQEVGVRLALGATRFEIFRLVLGQAVVLSLIGIGIGLLGAWWLTGYLRGLLFGITAYDPLVFSAIPVLLLAVTFLASQGPARRATRVDPMAALHCE